MFTVDVKQQCNNNNSKFRPKKNDKMKVNHGVVAVGIVCGGEGGGGGAGPGGFMSCHT